MENLNEMGIWIIMALATLFGLIASFGSAEHWKSKPVATWATLELLSSLVADFCIFKMIQPWFSGKIVILNSFQLFTLIAGVLFTFAMMVFSISIMREAHGK